MVLKKLFRKQTGRFEYALVSKTSGRVLFWFGIGRPTKSEFLRQERRIQFFKNKKSFTIVRSHRRNRSIVKKHMRRLK